MKRVHKGVEYDNDGEIKFGANSGNGNVSLWKRGQEQNFIFKVHIELSNNTLACYTKGGQCGSSECVRGFPSICLPKWPSLDCSLDEWLDKDTRGHNLSCSVWKPSLVSEFFVAEGRLGTWVCS